HDFGSTVRYTCIDGYRLVGQRDVRCVGENTWSADPPVCERTPCNKTDVPNSIIFPNKDVFQPGEYVAYSCLPGYTLTGRNSTRCLPNGQWTGSRPECQKMRCPNLVVNNGGVSPVTHVWEFGDTATITCDDGHRLAGSGQIINCQANGEWDGAPTCEARRFCQSQGGDLATIKNADVRNHLYDFGSAVRYTCIDGYRLVGQRDVRCVGENSWSADPPVCEKMKCLQRNVANAQASPNLERHDFGSTVRYTCIDGYRLVGQRDVQCVGENTWSADPPVCERTPCNKTDVPNSIIFPNKDVFQPGEYVAYSCLPGYTLTGRNSTRCLPNGQWTGSRPECQKMKCLQRNVANAQASPNLERHDFGSTVRYTCIDGYRLVGQRDVRCVGENSWSADPPVCERMNCTGRNVPNARASPNFERHDFGSTVRYTCADGYRLVGQRDVQCVGENTWSADPPVCERIQCQIRAVANASTLPEGQSVWYSGDNVTYECFVGYLMVGSVLSTCRDDTTWSTPKPVCLKFQLSTGTPCNKTDVPNSIIFPNKDVFQPGEYVAYSCLPGYTLTGRNSTRCLPNGQWTGSRPECQS
uniref:Sushi domain-containing protein n=1 Tax=Ciona savignyi TaxID=51511 RepID=H2YG22_CIOSA